MLAKNDTVISGWLHLGEKCISPELGSGRVYVQATVLKSCTCFFHTAYRWIISLVEI